MDLLSPPPGAHRGLCGLLGHRMTQWQVRLLQDQRPEPLAAGLFLYLWPPSPLPYSVGVGGHGLTVSWASLQSPAGCLSSTFHLLSSLTLLEASEGLSSFSAVSGGGCNAVPTRQTEEAGAWPA